MFTRALGTYLLILIFVGLILACSPTSEPLPTEIPSQAPSPTDIVPASSSPTDVVLQTDAPITPTAEGGESVALDKNILVVIEGGARISQDNGNSWNATATGQYLVAGDELQLSDNGLALIFFFNGSVVRLEGPSDFQLMLAEADPESGATRIISRLWDGYALFGTNPLPTPDSVFQLYVMTSFINVEYDEEIAALGTSIDLDPDWYKARLSCQQTTRL